jgi:hypothetical protein
MIKLLLLSAAVGVIPTVPTPMVPEQAFTVPNLPSRTLTGPIARMEPPKSAGPAQFDLRPNFQGYMQIIPPTMKQMPVRIQNGDEIIIIEPMPEPMPDENAPLGSFRVMPAQPKR